MKVSMKLLFTLKSKRRNTNLKFDLKVTFWTPEKVSFWFLKRTPPLPELVKFGAWI